MRWYRIDGGAWGVAAVRQPNGRNWCYAACLTSVTRFLLRTTGTQIQQEHFVTLAFGQPTSTQTPNWNQYMTLLKNLTNGGITYPRPPYGNRTITFDGDMEKDFPDNGDGGHALSRDAEALIIGELFDGRPVICTIRRGAHDIVITGVAVNDTFSIISVEFWDPFSGTTYAQTRATFEREQPICVVSLFVPGGRET